jgi:hypothetical protein
MRAHSADYQFGTRVKTMREVIKKLRRDDLAAGHCFMILDDDLPHDQAYYEYPDGRIQIEQIDLNNMYRPLLFIRSLTLNEIEHLKAKNEVYW